MRKPRPWRAATSRTSSGVSVSTGSPVRRLSAAEKLPRRPPLVRSTGSPSNISIRNAPSGASSGPSSAASAQHPEKSSGSRPAIRSASVSAGYSWYIITKPETHQSVISRPTAITRYRWSSRITRTVEASGSERIRVIHVHRPRRPETTEHERLGRIRPDEVRLAHGRRVRLVERVLEPKVQPLTLRRVEIDVRADVDDVRVAVLLPPECAEVDVLLADVLERRVHAEVASGGTVGKRPLVLPPRPVRNLLRRAARDLLAVRVADIEGQRVRDRSAQQELAARDLHFLGNVHEDPRELRRKRFRIIGRNRRRRDQVVDATIPGGELPAELLGTRREPAADRHVQRFRLLGAEVRVAVQAVQAGRAVNAVQVLRARQHERRADDALHVEPIAELPDRRAVPYGHLVAAGLVVADAQREARAARQRVGAPDLRMDGVDFLAEPGDQEHVVLALV